MSTTAGICCSVCYSRGGRQDNGSFEFDPILEARSKIDPGDVVIAILTRLPVKSLLRFKCVCWSWHALIHSLAFINMHHNRAKRSTFIRYSKDDVMGHHSLSVSEDGIITDLHLPPPTHECRRFSNIVVVGACRGMVCLSSQWCPNTAVVMNIATREYRFLCNIGRETDRYYSLATGFTFLANINDYKLVKIIIYADHTAYIKITRWNTSIPAKEMEADFPYVIGQQGCCLNANEAIHLLGRKTGSQGPHIIIAFDMVEDKFREIAIPPLLHNERLALLKETLAISGFSLSSTDKLLFHVWALHDYRGASESWVEQFTLDMSLMDLQPRGLWLNGEVVLATVNGLNPRLYDTHTKQYKEFPIHIDGCLYYNSIIHYKESLVPVAETTKKNIK